MKTFMRMYLRRKEKRGHEEVIVNIDWEDADDKTIRLLAGHYILLRAAEELKNWDEKLPAEVDYRAVDMIHNEPLTQKDYDIPETWKEGKHSKAYKHFKALMEGLSPEELRILLK